MARYVSQPPITAFRLIGRPTVTFNVTRAFEGFPNAPKGHRMPCVTGVSTCGKWRTTARVADVEPVA